MRLFCSISISSFSYIKLERLPQGGQTMQFVDECKIELKAGDGGNGIIS